MMSQPYVDGIIDKEGYSGEECKACNKFPVSGAPK